eukprot:gnl/MRDRNA2_/MRDRNA2_155991_c0_seq1.p1 gnl/MRDRNA2_/MRDRNA2_155991_c0~~gnl/MRDRNA2_/MRDRNA2_155991_c0_seq1.p1  ORF type:complete len:609 (-),score=88.35 gnl/MRDRNA2_/MRDRNA2_155991_c0_seq1:103-1929(-)
MNRSHLAALALSIFAFGLHQLARSFRGQSHPVEPSGAQHMQIGIDKWLSSAQLKASKKMANRNNLEQRLFSHWGVDQDGMTQGPRVDEVVSNNWAKDHKSNEAQDGDRKRMATSNLEEFLALTDASGRVEVDADSSQPMEPLNIEQMNAEQLSQVTVEQLLRELKNYQKSERLPEVGQIGVLKRELTLSKSWPDPSPSGPNPKLESVTQLAPYVDFKTKYKCKLPKGTKVKILATHSQQFNTASTMTDSIAGVSPVNDEDEWEEKWGCPRFVWSDEANDGKLDKPHTITENGWLRTTGAGQPLVVVQSVVIVLREKLILQGKCVDQCRDTESAVCKGCIDQVILAASTRYAAARLKKKHTNAGTPLATSGKPVIHHIPLPASSVPKQPAPKLPTIKPQWEPWKHLINVYGGTATQGMGKTLSEFPLDVCFSRRGIGGQAVGFSLSSDWILKCSYNSRSCTLPQGTVFKVVASTVEVVNYPVPGTVDCSPPTCTPSLPYKIAKVTAQTKLKFTHFGDTEFHRQSAGSNPDGFREWFLKQKAAEIRRGKQVQRAAINKPPDMESLVTCEGWMILEGKILAQDAPDPIKLRTWADQTGAFVEPCDPGKPTC